MLLRQSRVSQADLVDPDGYLFPVWGNVRISSDTDVIANFTGRALGFRLTSTNLRAVTETEAEQAFRDGRITQGQRSSIKSVNGHGGRVITLIVLTLYVYYRLINLTHNCFICLDYQRALHQM